MEDHHEPRRESVLKPNRPLRAKLGGGWEAKRARSLHVSSITINHRRMAPFDDYYNEP